MYTCTLNRSIICTSRLYNLTQWPLDECVSEQCHTVYESTCEFETI